jgi:hypothetical protein
VHQLVLFRLRHGRQSPRTPQTAAGIRRTSNCWRRRSSVIV